MFKVIIAFLLFLSPLYAQDLKGHGGPIRALAIKGDRLISGSFDTTIIVWDIKNNAAIKILRAHEGSVNTLSFIDEKTFISGGEDGKILLWDLTKDTPIKQVKAHEAPISSFLIHNNSIFSVGWDGALVKTDLNTFITTRLVTSETQINSITLFQEKLVTASSDGTLKYYDLNGKTLEVSKKGEPINSLKTTKTELILGLANGNIRINNQSLEAQSSPIIALSLSQDEKLLAAASIAGSVTLINLEKKQKLYALEGPGLPVWSALIDGDTLYTGGNDKLIRRWDTKTGEHQGAVINTVTNPLTPINTSRGAEVFKACAFCHTLTEAGENRAGPTLYNIINRKIGSVKSYHYSESLTNKPLIWTADNIKKLFEIGPNAMLPGTKMPEQIINNAADREALIEFLRSFSKK